MRGTLDVEHAKSLIDERIQTNNSPHRLLTTRHINGVPDDMSLFKLTNMRPYLLLARPLPTLFIVTCKTVALCAIDRSEVKNILALINVKCAQFDVNTGGERKRSLAAIRLFILRSARS